MNETIAISCGHDEAIVPNNHEYERFFELLRLQGRRTEVVDGELSLNALEGYSALLLGDPAGVLSETECAAVCKWVASGGSAIVIGSHAGNGDGFSTVEDVEDLCPFVEYNGAVSITILGERTVTRTKGGLFDLESKSKFKTEVPIDVSSLTGEPSEILYHTGVSFSCAGPPRVVLPVPSKASVVYDLHFEPEGESRCDSIYSGAEDSFGDFALYSDAGPVYSDVEIVFGEFEDGAGAWFVFGAAASFRDRTIGRADNLLFANWLLQRWLPRLAEGDIRSRMRSPQRHRLLHGYPMRPMMPPVNSDSGKVAEELQSLRFDTAKPLLVGLLPHPFCNPRVKGCGFCTFPHQVFHRASASKVIESVAREMNTFFSAQPEFEKRPTTALYFGGSTANLSPPEAFRRLCRTTARHLDLTNAEVTLEGVPIYFVKGPDLLEILGEELPTHNVRISMGIQTFDPQQLKKMGRSIFGDPDTFAQVVRAAHRNGFAVSGDLLINLPGQDLTQMHDDLTKAIDLGLDQVCLYHLVLFEGLGTEWSKDPELLAQLPENEEACANFCALRKRLLESGFVQKTLTNFERAEHQDSDQEFRYERSVFRPQSYDWLGFGPTAISLLCAEDFRSALKVVNPEEAEEYNELAAREPPTWERAFHYSQRDMKVLYLTRSIATLEVSRPCYRELFHCDPLDDFAPEFAALAAERLVSVEPDRIQVTPRGNFYADTVAGLLARGQVAYYRAKSKSSQTAPAEERWYWLREKRQFMG